MRHHRTGLASGADPPIDISLSSVGDARQNVRAIVLLGRVQPIGEPIVGVNSVDLRSRLVILRGPGLAAIVRNVRATVVRLDHRVAVTRADPDVVVVTVRRGHPGHRPAAVRRFPKPLRARIDDVGVRRIGAERRVVEGPLDHGTIVVHQHPTLTRVVGAIQPSSGLGLDERINAIGIRGGHAHVRLADQLAGQAVHDMLEALAAVGALVEATFA